MKPYEITCLLCVLAFIVGAWLIPIGLYTNHLGLFIIGPLIMGASVLIGLCAAYFHNPRGNAPFYE